MHLRTTKGSGAIDKEQYIPTTTMSYDRVGNLINATTADVVTNLYAYDIVGNCINEWKTTST